MVASLKPRATAQASVNAGSVASTRSYVVRRSASVSSSETPWLPRSLPTTSQASVALLPTDKASPTASYDIGRAERTRSESAGSAAEGGPVATFSRKSQNPMTPPFCLRVALSGDETGQRAGHDASFDAKYDLSHHTDVTGACPERWSICECLAVAR